MIDLAIVAERHRDTVRDTLDATFSNGDIDAIEPGPSGASGATTFRVRGAAGDHLLRIEGDRIPGRNPHQYRNLRAASDAAIAPPVRLVDEEAGVLVMQWVETRPLSDFPGGPPALVRAVGELIGEVQQLDPFPEHDDWAEAIGRMLGYAEAIGCVAPAIAGPIAATYERIRSAWPRDPAAFVPAHNDPNASNLLFDGDRLWLVDWETSAPNDALVDLAVAANQLAPDDALRDALVEAWRGAPPDDLLRARLTLAQLSATLFAGAAISLVVGHLGGAPIVDLDAAPSPLEFEDLVRRGALTIGTPETMSAFAGVVLSQFHLHTSTPEFETALQISAAG